jgi:hypothetical protein
MLRQTRGLEQVLQLLPPASAWRLAGLPQVCLRLACLNAQSAAGQLAAAAQRLLRTRTHQHPAAYIKWGPRCSHAHDVLGGHNRAVMPALADKSCVNADHCIPGWSARNLQHWPWCLVALWFPGSQGSLYGQREAYKRWRCTVQQTWRSRPIYYICRLLHIGRYGH